MTEQAGKLCSSTASSSRADEACGSTEITGCSPSAASTAQAKDSANEVSCHGADGREQHKYTLLQAVGFNTMYMFGTGPLITIPYCLNAVDPKGPHALIGYCIACLACTLDAMVWSEIGSMWPESGGSYVYLRELFGRQTWGRFASFMFIWQFLISGPAEVASGFIAISEYLVYFSPDVLDYWPRVAISLTGLFLCSLLLFRGVHDVGRVTIVLWAITLLAMAYTIIAGFTAWYPENLEVPRGAYDNPGRFLRGIAAATRFGVYDMTGYYDVCFLGGEVCNPKRTIPVSCMATCVIVAVVYVLIYIAVLGHLPWESWIDMYSHDYNGNPAGIMSIFTESRVGKGFAYIVTIFVSLTIFGSVFSMLCGFGYLPYAAAKDGLFFSVFKHESRWYPGLADYSLLLVVGLSAVFCFFDIELVIDAMTTMLVLVQFAGQSVGLLYYRHRTPVDEQPESWRMPLFPLPCILQIILFLFIWVTSPSRLLWNDDKPILELSVAFLAFGAVLFLLRQRKHRSWPFGDFRPSVAGADSSAAAGLHAENNDSDASDSANCENLEKNKSDSDTTTPGSPDSAAPESPQDSEPSPSDSREDSVEGIEIYTI